VLQAFNESPPSGDEFENTGEIRMTTRNITLNAFALEPHQGRTLEPLNILGEQTLVKLANVDTDGAVAIFQQTIPPLAGPPLHRHANEDEWFYVLDGQITIEVDGERSVLHGGGSAFVPRGTVHAFKNFGKVRARILVLATPGRFQHFFEDVSALSGGETAPDLAQIEQLAEQCGIEILGPPLSESNMPPRC
jgi:mannose-6-phosphate isomerase-like protein (cupin superfamily)